MKKLESAIDELHKISDAAAGEGVLNSLHPLPKLLVTLIYIAIVVSVDKYRLHEVVYFAVYPIFMFSAGSLGFSLCLKRIKLILPLVCLVGIFDPLLNDDIILFMEMGVNAGIISMLVLMIKGILTVLASYILMVTTPMEKICAALSMLRIPKVIVTQVMLMHRYIMLLMQEARRVSNAYKLRAADQKGIHISAWGSLTGQMVLRSIDRAGEVYESMLLRGYNPETSFLTETMALKRRDVLMLITWTAVFILMKFLIR